MKTYEVFHRTWWKDNKSWPEGREPCIGRKTKIARGVSYNEALSICKEYNSTHKPGKLSRKAEFQED